MQGISNSTPSNSSLNQQEPDGESVVSASSEELDCSEADEVQEETELTENFGEDFINLFQAEDKPEVGRSGAFCFSPCNKEDIPQILISKVKACDISLG